ncbi:MAG: four helix bundle protein [candidate division WOR-3 bacterium]|nr:four helix bundle protein [candidate division WOR-3 bacterium]
MSRSENQNISGEDTRISENQEKLVAGFEKLWVWQKAHKLMLEIHEICKTLPKQERFKIGDQAERSSSSVADNVAEGHTSYYYQDKIKGFNTARKEAGETQNHIRSMQGKNYITTNLADDLIGRYEEVIRGINGYINWVRRKRGDRK